MGQLGGGPLPAACGAVEKAEPRPCDRPSEEDYRDGSGVFDIYITWRRWA